MNSIHLKAIAIANQRYLPNSIYNKVPVKGIGVCRMRSLRLYKDANDELYVRVGKRGSCRVYLKDMRRADVIEATGTPVFYE